MKTKRYNILMHHDHRDQILVSAIRVRTHAVNLLGILFYVRTQKRWCCSASLDRRTKDMGPKVWTNLTQLKRRLRQRLRNYYQ